MINTNTMLIFSTFKDTRIYIILKINQNIKIFLAPLQSLLSYFIIYSLIILLRTLHYQQIYIILYAINSNIFPEPFRFLSTVFASIMYSLSPYSISISLPQVVSSSSRGGESGSSLGLKM